MQYKRCFLAPSTEYFGMTSCNSPDAISRLGSAAECHHFFPASLLNLCSGIDGDLLIECIYTNSGIEPLIVSMFVTILWPNVKCNTHSMMTSLSDPRFTRNLSIARVVVTRRFYHSLKGAAAVQGLPPSLPHSIILLCMALIWITLEYYNQLTYMVYFKMQHMKQKETKLTWCPSCPCLAALWS